MPLFCCTNCRCVENTATSNYWQLANKNTALCSECDPEIGQWHGEFPKRSAAGMLVDQHGHLWSRDSVDAGQLPASCQIVGEVVETLEAAMPKLMKSARDLGVAFTPCKQTN